MPTALITGANRGIGLALATCYAARSGAYVIALTRDIASSDELLALAKSGNGNVRVVQADVANATSIKNLSREVQDVTIDLLVNNAGTGGFHEFGEISEQEIIDVFRVNAFAPLLVTQALQERLARGGKIVNITSVLGSMEKARNVADALTYAMSKAALNMLSVKLAKTMRPHEIAVLAIHPGGVRTRMGGPTAPISAETSANGMMGVIDDFKMEQSGAFLDYDGAVIAW